MIHMLRNIACCMLSIYITNKYVFVPGLIIQELKIASMPFTHQMKEQKHLI